MPELRPDRLLGVLEEHGVEFVVIGGFAATIHGSPFVTTDLDITPDRSRRNLERLSDALRALRARIRVEGIPGGLPFDHDPASLLRTRMLNLTTDAGDLDITFEPEGTQGYEDLVRDAAEVDVLGVRIRIASLADVVRSKEAAGRPKDLIALPILRRMLEEAPEYLAGAELLQGGAVLLTLWGTRPGRTPMEVQCLVRRGDEGTWRLRRGTTAGDSPDGLEVRFPDDFDGAPGLPLGPGRYEVTWIQARFARNLERVGEDAIGRTWFSFDEDGRFEAGSLVRA